MLNKVFKYIDNLATFNTLKVSIDESDTGYRIGNSAIVIGKPEIKWENICFIELEKKIWTHGIFFTEEELTRLTDLEIAALMPTDPDFNTGD